MRKIISGWSGWMKILLVVTAIVGLADAGHPATYMLIDVSGGPNATNYPVNYMAAMPAGGWTDEHKTGKIVLRRIPAGTFTMGSPMDELGRESFECPHPVTLSTDFYIGIFPVTQKQWERVTGDWPSHFTNAAYRDTRPVEQVSYYDIREIPDSTTGIEPTWPQSADVGINSFIGKLRAKTGLPYLDLPTEAQWEYACRAGTATALNTGRNLTDKVNCPSMDQAGRYQYNHPGGYSYSPDVGTQGGTATVGSYPPNRWGLYDMHGNVWEWCLDWFQTYLEAATDPAGPPEGSFRVLRGGCWMNPAWSCRSAVRNSNNPPWYSIGDRGLRIAGTLGEADPDPDLGPAIRANGRRGVVALHASERVTITITINNGVHTFPVDWFVIVIPHGAGGWHYLDTAMQWIEFPAANLSACAPARYGPLMDIAEPIAILRDHQFHQGTYDFYFIIDYPMNGRLDLIHHHHMFDRVTVTVARLRGFAKSG